MGVNSEPQTQPDICRVSSRAAMAGDGGSLGECCLPQEGVNGEGWEKGVLLQEEDKNTCGKPGMNNLLLNI